MSRVAVVVRTPAGTPYVIECADSVVAGRVKQDVGTAEGWTVQETADVITASAFWRLSGVAIAGNPQIPSEPAG